MKKTRKIISVLLAMLMMMTYAGLCASGYAAATTAQWNTLIDALKNDNVKNAEFKGNSGTLTVADATGDILKAMNAYMSVFNSTYTSSATQTTTNRTSSQVKDYIKTQLNSKMGNSDFTAYNVGSVLDGFNANVNVNSGESTSSGSIKSPTIQITVTVDPAAALAAYDSIEDMPASVTNSYTFSITHTQKNYTPSGCGASKTYYLITGAMSSKAAGSVSKSTLANAKAVFDSYADLFDNTLAQDIALGSEYCQTALSKLNTALKDVSASLFAKFFSEYSNFAEVANALEVAVDIAQYTDLVEEIVAYYNTDYSAYSKDELNTLYNNFKTDFDIFDACADSVKDYFGITDEVKAQYIAKLSEINKAYQIADLTLFLNEKVQPAYDTYSLYNEDEVISGAVAGTQLEKAKGEISGYINALNSYDYENVITVFGNEKIAALNSLNDELAYLIEVADADAGFAAKYSYFVETVSKAVDLSEDSEGLLEAVMNYDSWFSNLKDFEAELAERFGANTAAKIFDGLDVEMKNVLDSKYQLLYSRISAEINTADALLVKAVVTYGNEVTIVSIETFGKLKDAIGFIEKDIYDFLDTTPNFELDSELVEKYEALCAKAFDDYYSFLETAGLEKYEQTTMDDIIRSLTDSDKVRNEDYEVTDEKLETIIDLIDKALASDELKSLGVDLKSLLSPDLLEGLYSDSVINSIVQYVYPVVAKEFAKVWADLPSTVEADSPLGGGKLDVALSLYDLTTSMKNIRFFIFPGLLADNISAQYPEVAAVLKKATTKPVYYPDTDEMDNPWEDAAICNEDGTLALNWGIDEAENKEEAFLDAAQAALSGLEPLLLALISNKTLSGQHTDNDNSIATDGKPGHGKVGTGKTSIKILVSISVTVDPINLFLDISGNPGYNNAIVPIFEALGLDSEYIPDGNTFTSVREVLKLGLIEPVKALLAQIAEAPVDFVLKALPNLAYALESGRIVPLLSMLKADINYHADAHYSAVAGLASGDIPEALSDGPISIDLGEMIDLKDLGVDLSSFNALIKLLSGLIGEDVILPKVESGKLATLGELTWKDTKRQAKTYNCGPDGKAAYIEANRADVLLFVLDYVFGALKVQPELLDTIIAAVNAPEEGEEAEPVEIPEIVNVIIDNVLANSNDSIAALTELIFPKEYTTSADTLALSRDTLAPDYMVTDLRTGETKYTYDITTDYTKYWTEDKAEYVAEHLSIFLDDLVMLFGLRINGEQIENLGSLIDGLCGNLYTADTVNKIADTLAGLLGGLDVEDDVKTVLTGILNSTLDADISFWTDYETDFEDGNREAFAASLKEVLAPAAALLKFILADEDIIVSLTGADGSFKVIEAKGYAGYKYGLIPLFEALGAEDTVLTEEEFLADKDNIISNILAPVFEILDNVAADPYNAVETIVPNLLYFLASDGLEVAADNLLYAVDQLLETIRPIYPVDLSELVGFDIRFAENDPLSFLCSELAALVEEKTGISFDIDFNSTDLLSNLNFGTVIDYTSKTGDQVWKVVPDDANSAAMITEILRFVFGEVLFSENTEKLLNLAKNELELPDEVYYPLYSILFGMYYMRDTHIDYALGILYWAFYGVDTAVEHVAPYYKFMSYDWKEMADTLSDEATSNSDKALYIFREVYDKTAMTIVDDLYEEGTIPLNSTHINGFITLAKRLFNFFRQIFEMLKNRK